MNVQRYPRLLTVWLVGCVLAVPEGYVPRLVGIDARHTEYATLADFALALVLAGLIYRWIVGDSRRTAILLDIVNRFEEREVCSVLEHNKVANEETFEPEEEENYDS
jgi:hypothetical protein